MATKSLESWVADSGSTLKSPSLSSTNSSSSVELIMERGRRDIFTHEEEAASVTFCLCVWNSSSE